MRLQPSAVDRRLAAMVASGARRRPAIRSRLSQLTLEEKVFAALTAIIAIHLADIAIAGPRFGGGSINQLIALVPLALLPPLLALFVWGRRRVRTLLSLAIDVSVLVMGLGVYLPHLILGQAEGSDFTGILATLAAVAYLALAFRIGLDGTRWFVKVLAIPVSLVVLVQWALFPASMAAMHVSVARPVIPAADTLGIPGASDVTFNSRDGVSLSAWYVPGTNGAAVILLHGTGGSRLSMVQHMRMLAASGYAVLNVDARGHGKSGGQANSWGWRASDTIAGAVQFLRDQSAVDPNRIAALGESTGAMEALRAAAEGVPLAAVIAEGPGPLTVGDQGAELTLMEPAYLMAIDQSAMWVSMRLTTLYTGELEPTPLIDIAGRISVPVLIIAANPAIDPGIGHPPGERVMAKLYQQRIGAKASLWYVDDAGHSEELNRHPDAYRSRVTAFLSKALLRQSR